MNVTQSTVSRSLADIEQEIGFALFHRRAREVVATDRGRIFLNRAARLISDLEQLEDDARNARETDESLIRVGISPAAMQGLVNKAVTSLMFSRKDLRIHLTALSVDGGVQALRRGDIDILVAPETATKNEPAFIFEHLGDLRTNLFTRKKHPLLERKKIRAADIIDYPVVAPDQRSWHADQLRSLFKPYAGDAVRQMHIVEYFPLVADIVAGSDSIGVVGSEYSISKAFLRRFTLLDIEAFDPLAIGFSTRKRWLATPAIDAFQSALRSSPPGL